MAKIINVTQLVTRQKVVATEIDGIKGFVTEDGNLYRVFSDGRKQLLASAEFLDNEELTFADRKGFAS